MIVTSEALNQFCREMDTFHTDGVKHVFARFDEWEHLESAIDYLRDNGFIDPGIHRRVVTHEKQHVDKALTFGCSTRFEVEITPNAEGFDFRASVRINVPEHFTEEDECKCRIAVALAPDQPSEQDREVAERFKDKLLISSAEK